LKSIIYFKNELHLKTLHNNFQNIESCYSENSETTAKTRSQHIAFFANYVDELLNRVILHEESLQRELAFDVNSGIASSVVALMSTSALTAKFYGISSLTNLQEVVQKRVLPADGQSLSTQSIAILGSVIAASCAYGCHSVFQWRKLAVEKERTSFAKDTLRQLKSVVKTLQDVPHEGKKIIPAMKRWIYEDLAVLKHLRTLP